MNGEKGQEDFEDSLTEIVLKCLIKKTATAYIRAQNANAKKASRADGEPWIQVVVVIIGVYA